MEQARTLCEPSNTLIPLVDYVMFLTHDPKMDINPNEVSATRWVSKADLEEFFQDPGQCPGHSGDCEGI